MAISLHPIASLMAGIIAHLKADADLQTLIGGAIYEAMPVSAQPPLIALGSADLREIGGVDAPEAEIGLDLVLLTRERGTLDILTLASAVEKALSGPLPMLSGHRLVLLDRRGARIRHDTSRATARAEIRLVAITEPA